MPKIQTSAGLDEEVFNQVQTMANDQDRSISWVINALITKALEYE